MLIPEKFHMPLKKPYGFLAHKRWQKKPKCSIKQWIKPYLSVADAATKKLELRGAPFKHSYREFNFLAPALRGKE